MAQKGRGSCPTLSLMHTVGKRWTIPVLEALYFSHRSMQFNAIQGEVGRITPRNLSRCLRELADADLVEKSETLSGAGVVGAEYALTERGMALQKLILQAKSFGICWYGVNSGCTRNRCSGCPLF